MAFNQNNAQKIWKTVCKVPVGKVSSYGLIADLAGLPGRARLVGKVLQFVPAEMSVPWYRILKSNGQLAFPEGSKQSKIQQDFLQQELVIVQNNRVDLKKFGWKPDLGELMELDY